MPIQLRQNKFSFFNGLCRQTKLSNEIEQFFDVICFHFAILAVFDVGSFQLFYKYQPRSSLDKWGVPFNKKVWLFL